MLQALLLIVVLLQRIGHLKSRTAVAVSLVSISLLTISACGGDTLGVATTVVNVTPTNFATIPPVASTLPGTTTTLPSGAVGQETIYTVKSGDTPIGVANRYGISLNTLLAYNAMVTPDQFPYPGQTLRIPAAAVVNPDTGTTLPGTSGGTGPVSAGCGTRPAGTYAIEKGDSFFAIQKKFCVTLGALLTANNWADSSQMLMPGEIINIPAAGS